MLFRYKILFIVLFAVFLIQNKQGSTEQKQAVWEKNFTGYIREIAWAKNSEYILIIMNIDNKEGVTTSSIIDCLDRNGNILWEQKKDKIAFINLDTSQNSDIIVGGFDLNESGKSFLFDIKGNVLREYDKEANIISPDGNQIIYYNPENTIFGSYNKGGKTLWNEQKLGIKKSILAVKFFPNDPKIIATTGDATVYCLKLNGEILWTKKFGKLFHGDISISNNEEFIAFGTSLQNKDHILVFTKNGNIFWQKIPSDIVGLDAIDLSESSKYLLVCGSSIYGQFASIFTKEGNKILETNWKYKSAQIDEGYISKEDNLYVVVNFYFMKDERSKISCFDSNKKELWSIDFISQCSFRISPNHNYMVVKEGDNKILFYKLNN